MKANTPYKEEPSGYALIGANTPEARCTHHWCISKRYPYPTRWGSPVRPNPAKPADLYLHLPRLKVFIPFVSSLARS